MLIYSLTVVCKRWKDIAVGIIVKEQFVPCDTTQHCSETHVGHLYYCLVVKLKTKTDILKNNSQPQLNLFNTYVIEVFQLNCQPSS